MTRPVRIPREMWDTFDMQRLLELQLSWRIGPERDDQPAMSKEIDEDGMVRRFRVVSAAEALDELIAECRGEVAADD